MITTRVTDRPDDHGGYNPKITITVQGTHDVSRITQLLASGLVEHVIVAADLVRKLRKVPGGVAALKVLAEHGGPDYTQEYPGGHDPEAGE
jgi:hypothetical protein